MVFKSRSVLGPWVRQTHADVNCRDAMAPVCGGFGDRSGQLKDLVYNAQWWGPSIVPSADPSAEPTVMFTGRRWLSGSNLPEGCHDICGNRGNPSKCLNGGDQFQLKSDYSVWYPLDFDDTTGDIKVFVQLSSFQLNIPGDDPIPPPSPSPTPPPTPPGPSPGVFAVPLWRCTDGRGHFLSTSGCGSGHQESQLGCIGDAAALGAKALYQCLNQGSDSMPSLQADCEGQTMQSLLGYVQATSTDDASRALYRCQVPGPDHFASLVSDCEGQRFEGLLGYIAPFCASEVIA